MSNCIFCKIIRREIPTKFVWEDEDFIAFRDINPLAPVHILIVPKKHIEGIQAVQKKDEKILGKILLVAQKIAAQEKLQGYKLFFNCGKLGGQVIFHLHLHLVGGWKNSMEGGVL